MIPRSVYHYTDGTTFGGAQRVIESLIAKGDRDAWRPTVVMPPNPEFADRLRRLAVPIIETPPLPLGVVGAWRLPTLYRVLRRDRPDVLHVHLSWPLSGKYALMAGELARVPTIVATVHSLPRFTADRSNMLQLWVLSRQVDAFVASSRTLACELTAAMHWPTDKIHVITNGVDADQIALHRGIARDQRPLVLSAARLVPDKGMHLLVEAARDLPDARVIIAGDGPERGNLEALARSLGVADRVDLVGHRADIAELLAACDIFVLATKWEGVESPSAPCMSATDDFLPLAVLEAMAAARPVVMTRVAAGDAIDDGVNGLHVPRGDVHAIVQALRRLIDDARLREELGDRAAATVRGRFSIKQTIEQTEALYRALVTRPKSRLRPRATTRTV
ncbi:MAG TPA: glycosyltransferase [Acidimicrobiia bacterium]|nr:glycosyltransferase [Acidimicrobiia bacterium]